jgi:hypothetical protein
MYSYLSDGTLASVLSPNWIPGSFHEPKVSSRSKSHPFHGSSVQVSSAVTAAQAEELGPGILMGTQSFPIEVGQKEQLIGTGGR